MGTRRRFLVGWCAVAVLATVALFQTSACFAQTRINDKDMENLMRNLTEDAKNFHQSFDKAVSKSAIRKTSQEKDAKNLADNFARQAEELAKNFKKTHKADAAVPPLVDNAGKIDRLVYQLNLGTQTTVAWESARSALHQVAAAYGVQEPYLQGADQASATAIGSCNASVGKKEAQRLVEECLKVSPATHPPCNAQNSCALITDEIRRGCGMIGAGAPGFCGEFR